MIQNNQDPEINVKRNLDRLTETLMSQNFEALIPAFAFATKLLQNYIRTQRNHIKISYYSMIFVKLIEGFREKLSFYQDKQLITLSKNKKTIVGDILLFLQRYKGSTDQYKGLQRQQHQILRSKVDGLVQQIYNYYEEHNLDQAYQRIIQLQKISQTHISQVLMKEHRTKIKKIENQYLKMIKFYSHFQSQGWIFDKEEGNIRMYYKVYQQEKTIAVKILAQIDMEMLPFLAIINEVQLQKTYVPFVYVSELVKTLGRNKKAAYSKTYVPLLTDRECYYCAVGYDRMQTTGTIFCFTETYDQDFQMQQEYSISVPLPEKSEYVRLKVQYFCINYQPLSKTRAKVTLVTKANFKLTFLPLFILQKSARVFTFDYFQNIVKNAKNYKGSQWQQKVNQNPSLYRFFQSKIDQYLT